MLVKHNKNSKGFIQIPILIAIIISVLIVGTGGYFGVKQYQSYQAKEIEKEKVAIEQKQKEDEETKAQEDAKAVEVENLRREVEELKKSQAKIENTKPPVTPEIKKTFSTAQIVSQNKKFIVNIICQTGDGSVYGSGVIIGRSQNDLIILTNYHVTKYAKTPPAGVPPCIVVGSGAGLGESNEFYYGQPIYYPNVASQDTMSLIDFSFIEIKDPIPSETMYYDETTGKYTTQKSTPETTLLSTYIFPKICSQNLLKLGEEIIILGYPTIGGDSILPGVPNTRLIATEGIISNTVSSFDNYFVSSAKIEQGNSGGGAFLKSVNCLAGMPTYVRVGAIESLGRLINLPKLKETYLSKIFYNL